MKAGWNRANCQGCTWDEDLASPNRVAHLLERLSISQFALCRRISCSLTASSLEEIAPWRAWQPCWAMLSGIPSSSARYLVECFSRRHGVDIELERPPTTFANAAYTASPLRYPAVVRPDVHLQCVSSTASSGFLRS
jgi:hypothetical protein